MSNQQVLFIEDDQELASLLLMHFRELGYECEHAADGEMGLKLALAKNYNIILLDRMLPKRDGLEVLRELREKKRYVPILMLTARGDEIDKILGLEMGADDYVTKPFKMPELIARTRAVIRRAQVHATPPEEAEAASIQCGDLAIDTERRRVFLGPAPVLLTALEYDFLLFLAREPGRTFTREEILEAVWQCTFSGYEHSINSLIKRLRKKIEADAAHPKFILTVRGVGYRFAESNEV